MKAPLDGLRILLLEDEFLIAMDVEQTCLDAGASNVTIVRSVKEAASLEEPWSFDAAIVDIMLAGESTLDFALGLYDRKVPFVFASGYADLSGLDDRFAEVEIVGKPYGGDDLVNGILSAIRRAPARVNVSDPDATPSGGV